jgi:hypothetical protein
MSSEFRTAILHTVVGTPTDFRPRSPFVPEVCLHKDSGPSVFIDLLLPVGQWGGWPAVLQESLQESRKSMTHLVGGIPFKLLVTDSNDRCLEFLTNIKRLLITARKNLTTRGVEEIRTGSLVATRECLDWYVPDTGPGGLTYLDRLRAIGFSEHLCVLESPDNGEVPFPFQVIPRPEPTTAGARKWAVRMVEEGHFLDLE